MFSKSVAYLTDRMVKSGAIQEEDREIYAYGLEVMFPTLLSYATAFVVSLALGMLFECVVFHLLFIPLRCYAGGYHAGGAWRCYLLSSAIIALTLFVLGAFDPQQLASVLLWPGVAAWVLIGAMAPIQSKNKPLDQMERKVYAKRARVILLLHAVAYLVCAYLELWVWAALILLTLLLMAVTLLVGQAEVKWSKSET